MSDGCRRCLWRLLGWLAVLPCLQSTAAPRNGLVLAEAKGGGQIRLEASAGCQRGALTLDGEKSAAADRRTGGLALAGLSPHASAGGDDALGEMIRLAAADHGLDAALLKAVVRVESAFEVDAVSHKGAMGLMQIMPATARGHGVADPDRTLFDPLTNLRAGARHLRRLSERYPNRLELAIAAYNAGEGAVKRWAGIPPYRETQQYVQKVLTWYETYRDEPDAAGPPMAWDEAVPPRWKRPKEATCGL